MRKVTPPKKKDPDATADAILGKAHGKLHTGPVHTKYSPANGGKK